MIPPTGTSQHNTSLSLPCIECREIYHNTTNIDTTTTRIYLHTNTRTPGHYDTMTLWHYDTMTWWLNFDLDTKLLQSSDLVECTVVLSVARLFLRPSSRATSTRSWSSSPRSPSSAPTSSSTSLPWAPVWTRRPETDGRWDYFHSFINLFY